MIILQSVGCHAGDVPHECLPLSVCVMPYIDIVGYWRASSGMQENDAIEVARSNENSSKDSPQVAGCPYSSIASSTDLCKGLSKSKGAASSGPSSIDCNTEQQPCDQLPATIPTNDAGSCPLGYGKVAMGQAQSKCPLGFTSGVMEGSPLNCRR